MLRTVYMPDSNRITVPIPEKYIGTELEILIFPLKEVSTVEKKTPDNDLSFGGWADMNKTDEDICSDIRASRKFRNRDFSMQ